RSRDGWIWASRWPRGAVCSPRLEHVLLLRETRLEQELHLVRGRAPERVARVVVRVGDLGAELVHRGVLARLVGRRDLDRLAPDLGGLRGRGVGALDPATKLVPVLVEEHDDRDRLVAVVQERVAEVRGLVA